MGCFSFLCKESGKPALSSSLDGSAVHIFLLKAGKVIEHMYGNYDSYGRVFSSVEKTESFKWQMDWHDVCDLHFSNDSSSGIAIILEEYYNGVFPTTKSEDDPDQGWGREYEYLILVGDSVGAFKRVENPFHKIYSGEE